MPITKLDDVCALVSIDLQKGVVGLPAAHPMEEIVGRTAQLARAFRERGLPVALVNVSGMAPGRIDHVRHRMEFPPDWTDLAPELGRQPGDILVTKQRWGAFLGTDLHDRLQQRGVTQIVLTGVATGIGVESTARSAYDLGYNVALVTDAMTDMDITVHKHSVEMIFPRLGECDTAGNVLKLLQSR